MEATRKTSLMTLAAATVAAAMTVFATAACSNQKFGLQEADSNFGQQVTYNTQVDVLWVVDTSGSMAKHQTALATQVPVFLDGLNATGLDYQIGVTTMDMSGSGQRGRLIAQNGTPTILKKTTPNLLPVLQGRLQAGEAGSPVERGREAMVTALSATGAGQMNAGFLRENSLLVVILLSNEEDDSDDGVNYISYLDTLKPVLPLGDRSWVAHFIGVVPTDPTCKTAEWNYISPGLRYMNLASASGGVSEPICGADFARALTNVRSRVLEMLTEFPLDRKPNESTIKVMVDGVSIPRSDVNGWSYRASANSIRFHGAAIPKAGARIHVTFDPEGLK